MFFFINPMGSLKCFLVNPMGSLKFFQSDPPIVKNFSIVSLPSHLSLTEQLVHSCMVYDNNLELRIPDSFSKIHFASIHEPNF